MFDAIFFGVFVVRTGNKLRRCAGRGTWNFYFWACRPSTSQLVFEVDVDRLLASLLIQEKRFSIIRSVTRDTPLGTRLDLVGWVIFARTPTLRRPLKLTGTTAKESVTIKMLLPLLDLQIQDQRGGGRPPRKIQLDSASSLMRRQCCT